MNRKQAEHDRTVLPRIRELMAEGRSLRGIAQQLEDDGVPTARPGGRWTHIAVGRILGPGGADAARGGELTAPAGGAAAIPSGTAAASG